MESRPISLFSLLFSQKSKKFPGEFDSSNRLGVTGEKEEGIKSDTSTFLFETSNSNTYSLRFENGDSCGGFSTCPTRFDVPCSLCSTIFGTMPTEAQVGFHFQPKLFLVNSSPSSCWVIFWWDSVRSLVWANGSKPSTAFGNTRKCASPMLEHTFQYMYVTPIG